MNISVYSDWLDICPGESLPGYPNFIVNEMMSIHLNKILKAPLDLEIVNYYDGRIEIITNTKYPHSSDILRYSETRLSVLPSEFNNELKTNILK